jgi:hypothetical protein
MHNPEGSFCLSSLPLLWFVSVAALVFGLYFGGGGFIAISLSLFLSEV